MTVLLLVMLLSGLLIAAVGLLAPALWAVALVLLTASLGGLVMRAGGDPHWYRS